MDELLSRACSRCFSSMTQRASKKWVLVLSLSLICFVASRQLLDLSAYFCFWNIRRLGRRGPNIQRFFQRTLTLICRWKALGKSEESETLVTDEPLSESSVFSYCPPRPTVRSLQHWLACQTCCHDNGLQITQMQAKILTQELLSKGLLVPFPDQTKGTMPQIL